MKKMSAALFLLAFTGMIGMTSFGFDKGPPGAEQTKVTKIIEKENLCITLAAEYPAQVTDQNPTSDQNLVFAESTAIKNAPALAVDEAALFYNISDKKIKKRSRDVDYTKIGYSMKYMRV